MKVAGSNNVAARDVYHHQLQGQVAARAETESRDREREAAQQSVHFQVGQSGSVQNIMLQCSDIFTPHPHYYRYLSVVLGHVLGPARVRCTS